MSTKIRITPFCMNSQDVKTVTLVINSDQTKKKLDQINTKLEVARKKREDAFNKGDANALQAYTKEIIAVR